MYYLFPELSILYVEKKDIDVCCTTVEGSLRDIQMFGLGLWMEVKIEMKIEM